MSAKRNLFLGLLIGAVLGGAISASLPLSDWTSAQDSRMVLLRQGWNQLVWTADNQPADTALAAIAGDLVMAYGWQGDSQTFTRYIPGRADVSTMGEVEKNSGYWLLMTGDAAFSVPTAAGQQCPQPTACPEPTACPSPSPSAGCEECASLLAACGSALDECDEAFWGMSDLLDECQDDVEYWKGEADYWMDAAFSGLYCPTCFDPFPTCIGDWWCCGSNCVSGPCFDPWPDASCDLFGHCRCCCDSNCTSDLWSDCTGW